LQAVGPDRADVAAEELDDPRLARRDRRQPEREHQAGEADDDREEREHPARLGDAVAEERDAAEHEHERERGHAPAGHAPGGSLRHLGRGHVDVRLVEDVHPAGASVRGHRAASSEW
jgi:hypothetical protein